MIWPTLPVPTRRLDGETLASYSARAAARNHTTVERVEQILREQNLLPDHPRSRRAPIIREAWRQLGRLDQMAFEEPSEVWGEYVTERRMCNLCAGGENVTARLPRIGLVCARHRRWLGTPQQSIEHLPDVVHAETVFRRHLVPKAVMFDSAVVSLARECAAVAATTAMLARHDDVAVALCPETVRFAILLTDTAFLRRGMQAVLEGAPLQQRVVAPEVAKIISEDEFADRWRAEVRICDYLAYLTSCLIDMKPDGRGMDKYNALRFLMLQFTEDG